MSRARIIALAIGLPAAAILGGAPTAAAQAAELTVGAGSYNEAPVLEPGRYSDTIRASETNIYAVDLQPGQQLRAEVVVDQRNFEGLGSIVALELDLDSPGRTPPEEGASELFANLAQAGRRAGVRVTGDVAQDPLEALGGEAFPAAGRWYARVTIDDPNGEAQRVEFPLKLRVGVLGTPTGEPVDPPTSEPEPDDEREEVGEDSDGSSLGTLALIGLGGGLLGALASVARGARTRSTRGDA